MCVCVCGVLDREMGDCSGESRVDRNRVCVCVGGGVRQRNGVIVLVNLELIGVKGV